MIFRGISIDNQKSINRNEKLVGTDGRFSLFSGFIQQ